MQKRMDDSIAAHADQEILYDQAEVAKDKLRVTGPFTVEAVPFPSVKSLDEAEEMAAGQVREADASIARSGESARQHAWRDELLKTGIRGKGGQMLKFAELETLPDTRYLHCSGHLDSGERVVVSFGPEHAALEQRQVEMAIREAGELFPRPKMIVFCAFTFDPEAAKDIDATKGITALKAQMNTDLLTEDLKKARASNQSFWLMGQPDVELRQRKDGRWEVEVHGFDYFDPKSGELKSGGKKEHRRLVAGYRLRRAQPLPPPDLLPHGRREGWLAQAQEKHPRRTRRSRPGPAPQHRQPALRTRRKPESRRQDRRRPGHRIAENPAGGELKMQGRVLERQSEKKNPGFITCLAGRGIARGLRFSIFHFTAVKSSGSSA